MAVAEDLHLDFLIPEYAVGVPDNECQAPEELRLFFCTVLFYHVLSFFSIENAKIKLKNTLDCSKKERNRNKSVSSLIPALFSIYSVVTSFFLTLVL